MDKQRKVLKQALNHLKTCHVYEMAEYCKETKRNLKTLRKDKNYPRDTTIFLFMNLTWLEYIGNERYK